MVEAPISTMQTPTSLSSSVSTARAPARGSSLKKPVLVLALLFAGFTALCAGLLRMFLRPGLLTPASASRTLDLPVLGVAPLKAT